MGQDLRGVVNYHQERVDAAQFVNAVEDRAAAAPGELMQVTEAEIEKTGLV